MGSLRVPIFAWLFSVGVPIVYIALLPGFSHVAPFNRGSFANPLRPGHMSISEMITTPQANGGFAAFTCPTIVYMWFNPMTQSTQSSVQFLGALFFTIGWILSIVLPLNFAAEESHGAGFAFGILGPLIFCFGFLIWTRWSVVMLVWLSLLIVFDIVALALFSQESTGFLAMEYVVGFLTASIAPLANTFTRLDSSPTLPFVVYDSAHLTFKFIRITTNTQLA